MILQAPINSLGYGRVGYEVAKRLSKLEHLFLPQAIGYLDFALEKVNVPYCPPEELTIYPIGQPEPDLYEELQQYDWRAKEDDSSINNGNTLKIWHQHQLHEFVGDGDKYGFPIFELNRFTREEIRSMRHCDKLFVCSHWAKDIVDEHVGLTNTKVVPLGVDRGVFNENNNVSRPATIFFNCGKWEIRKGHDFLKVAFENAFTAEDNVELWLMCENPFIGNKNLDWVNYYKNSKLGNKIKFIPRQKTHRDVYNIMRQVDCGVFPVKAEGWNLELLELLSCGKNVITTNYSGHTEYIDRNNSKIIEVESLEDAHDGIWFHGQGQWAKLEDKQLEQTVNHMRSIHSLKKNSDLQLNIAGIETAIKFSWDHTVEEILNEY